MTYTDQVLVSGHRGDRIHGIENTLTAFRLAIEAGCDMIETDVRMTKDGALILMHDETVDRTTDGTGRVKDLTLNEIQNLNAAVHQTGGFSPEPPALLSQLLELSLKHPSLLLNIEFKDYTDNRNQEFAFLCADKICEMLISYNVQERTWINSFDGQILEHIFRKHGRIFHYHGFYPWFILGKMTIDPESFIDVACMQHRYQEPDGTVVKYEEPMCPKEWFDYLLGKNIMPLMAPSLKEYPKYDTAFSWGSRIVNPDDPYAMLEHLRAIGLHK